MSIWDVFSSIYLQVLSNALKVLAPVIKGYLRYKSIFCYMVALDVQLIIFFYLRKICFFLEICSLCVFVKSTNFKICDVIIGIAALWKLHLCYFFWILSTIKMNFGQILVYLIANISNKFLAQCWRLGTSSSPVYDFSELII